jgi:hypothetical protein
MTATALTMNARRTEPVEAPQFSVVPAIDELVTRFAGRHVVSGTEVVDALLELRLVASLCESLPSA